jgi:hypothetical protein
MWPEVPQPEQPPQSRMPSRHPGVLIRVEPEEFSNLMNRAKDPLIVAATGGVFRRNYQYLMSYKGLTFFTKSGAPLPLPGVRSG